MRVQTVHVQERLWFIGCPVSVAVGMVSLSPSQVPSFCLASFTLLSMLNAHQSFIKAVSQPTDVSNRQSKHSQ